MARLKRELVSPLTEEERAEVGAIVDALDAVSDALYEKTRNAVREARKRLRALLARLERIE